MLKAIVITPNDKTSEYGSILAISRNAARKREKSQETPPIRAICFVAEIGVFVAVYEALDTSAKRRP